MLEILEVEAGSIGAELELEAGDWLLAINGQPVRDLLDVQVWSANEELLLEVRRRDGELWELDLEKEADAPLGLSFEHPEPERCGNNCLFCFVHQLPPGLRPTLYVKDEDYRFSYLYGAYVTLTNISAAAIERILAQRLSPLYVSVHATDEQLRSRLLGRAAPPILALLQRLADGGIELHTQIVVCPGINDGAELERTLTDLAGLRPAVKSVAVVPVGLTGYRQRLPQLRPHTVAEAGAVLDLVESWQRRCLADGDRRLVFAGDEYYLQAGRAFPPLEEYEGLWQVENGVGLIPQFRAEAAEVLAEARPLAAPSLTLVTGTAFAAELAGFATRLTAATGVPLAVQAIRNDFFGGQVDVAGLVSGRDLLAQLKGRLASDVLLVPTVMLRDGAGVFLDDLTPLDLERELGVTVRLIPPTPFGVWDALEELAEQSGDTPERLG